MADEKQLILTQNIVCLITKLPHVPPNDEHGDALGTEQNADEQYFQHLERDGPKT